MYIQNSAMQAVKMEQLQKNWMAQARAWPRKVWTRSIAQVKNRYTQLKNRYGLGYTIAILGAVLLTYPLPIPGITVSSIAFLVLIAEVHRAIFPQRRPSEDYCQAGGCGEDEHVHSRIGATKQVMLVRDEICIHP
jgi:hypothetical protein